MSDFLAHCAHCHCPAGFGLGCFAISVLHALVGAFSSTTLVVELKEPAPKGATTGRTET